MDINKRAEIFLDILKSLPKRVEPEIFRIAVNLYLVQVGARPAALVEPLSVMSIEEWLNVKCTSEKTSLSCGSYDYPVIVISNGKANREILEILKKDKKDGMRDVILGEVLGFTHPMTDLNRKELAYTARYEFQVFGFSPFSFSDEKLPKRYNRTLISKRINEHKLLGDLPGILTLSATIVKNE